MNAAGFFSQVETRCLPLLTEHGADVHDGREFPSRGVKLVDDLHFHVDSTKDVVEMYAAPLLAIVASRQNEDTTVAAEQLDTDAVERSLDSKEQKAQDSRTKRRRQKNVPRSFRTCPYITLLLKLSRKTCLGITCA